MLGEGFSTLILRPEAPVPALTPRSAPHHSSSDCWTYDFAEALGTGQVICDSTGFPLWVSDVRPGSTHDLTAARELVLPALYPHAARGLPVLADKGYIGAGVGVHVPVKHHPTGRCTPTTAATTS
jgi:hypothetical protein